MNSKTPNAADIAKKAYEIWEAEGRPEGRDVAHWHQAEHGVSEPVTEPIADVAPITDVAPPVAETAPPAPAVAPSETAATPAPKPRATRTRKPKDTSVETKPKTTRRRKTTAPEV